MSKITQENFTSISYSFDVVDFPIEKKYELTYYPALNVDLKLTFSCKFYEINEPINISLDGFYFNNPQLTTSNEALKSRIYSITATSLRKININTKWYIEGFGGNNVLKIELFTNTPIISNKYDDDEEIYLTIKYYTFCPSISKRLYEYRTSTPRWLRNLKYRKEHPCYMKDFVIPIIDSPETHTINFKFIAPAGWKFEFPYSRKRKKEDPVFLLLLDKWKEKEGDTKHLVPFGIDEDDMFKDDGKSLLSHHWEFTDRGQSMWVLSIHKDNFFKEVSASQSDYKYSRYLYPRVKNLIKKIRTESSLQKSNDNNINSQSYLIHSISFNQYAGSKNILIAYGSYMLVILSLIFTAVFTITLFYLGDKGIDYVNLIFAIIGLVTVLLAYFFSYKTQRDNKTISCIPDRKIQHNITIATVLAVICAVILLGFRIKTLILG